MGNNVKGARAKLYGKTDKRTRRVSSQPSIPPQDQVNLTTLLCNINDQIWGGSYKMFKLTHLKVSILNYQVPLKKKKKKEEEEEKIFVRWYLVLLWKTICLYAHQPLSFCLCILLCIYLLGGLYLSFSYLFIYFFLRGVGWIMEFDHMIFNGLIKYFWCPHRWSHILKVEEQAVIKIKRDPHSIMYRLLAPVSYGLWIGKRFFILVKFYFLVIFFNINIFFKLSFNF